MRDVFVVLCCIPLTSIGGDLPPPRVVDSHGDLMPPGAVLRLGKVPFEHGLGHLALSPDGKTIRWLQWGVHLRTFDYQTGRLIGRRTLPAEPAYQTCMSRDGTTAVLIRRPDGWTGPSLMEVWDLEQGKCRARMSHDDRGWSLSSLSADGRFLAGSVETYGIGNGKSVRITVWDTRTGEEAGRHTIDSLSTGAGWSSSPVFSADGRFVLYSCGVGQTGTYYCMDRATMKEVWRKTIDGGGFRQEMPDGRLLFAVPDAARAVSWADGTESPVRLPPKLKPNLGIGFVNRGETYLYVSDPGDGKQSELRAWDWKAGRPAVGLGPLRLGSKAWAAGFLTRDAADVFVIDGGWRLYDLRTGRPLWDEPSGAGHREAVASLVFSADGQLLASAAADKTVQLWDVTTGQSRGLWPAAGTGGYWEAIQGGSSSYRHEGPPALDLSADGRRLAMVAPAAIGHPIRLSVMDTASRRVLATRSLPTVKAKGDYPVGFGRVAFGPDGTDLWTSFGENDAGRSTEPFHTLARWNIATDSWKEVATVRPSPPARGAGNGTRWLAAGDVYDPASGRRAFELVGYANGPLTMSRDGRLAVGVGRSGGDPQHAFAPGTVDDVRVWDARSGSPVVRLPWVPPPRPTITGPIKAEQSRHPDPHVLAWPRRFAFHPSGRWLVTSDPHGVRMWDLVSKKVIHTFPVPDRPPLEREHGSPATALAFTPDGTRLATGLPDGTILFWPVPAPTPNPPAADALPALWADLTAADAAGGWRAAWRLMDNPPAAVRLVRTNLKPPERVPAADVARLLAEADAPDFRRRETATRRLTEVIDRVAPAVAEAAKAAGTSAELKERLGKLLAAVPGDDRPLPALAAGQARAVAVLEHARTPEARATLRELAGGAPGAWLTREAAAALSRLEPSTR